MKLRKIAVSMLVATALAVTLSMSAPAVEQDEILRYINAPPSQPNAHSYVKLPAVEQEGLAPGLYIVLQPGDDVSTLPQGEVITLAEDNYNCLPAGDYISRPIDEYPTVPAGEYKYHIIPSTESYYADNGYYYSFYYSDLYWQLNVPQNPEYSDDPMGSAAGSGPIDGPPITITNAGPFVVQPPSQ